MGVSHTAMRPNSVGDLLRTSGLVNLDAEILLGHVLGRPRAWILAHGDVAVHPQQRSAFRTLVGRRRAREPLAYLTGEKEFYGRAFRVTPEVLIPRPATETVVEVALEMLVGEEGQVGRGRVGDRSWPKVRQADEGIVVLSHVFEHKSCSSVPPRLVVDVGTGSGCIAVTLACEVPHLCVLGTDISRQVLRLALQNAARLGVESQCRFVLADAGAVGSTRHGHSHILKNVGMKRTRFQDPRGGFLLVSNPPYLPEGSTVGPEVMFEPREALFAGTRGLDVILPLVEQVRRHPQCVGFVIECLEEQASMIF